MTFEEWFSTQRMQSELAWDWAKAAWAAATLAEREACENRATAIRARSDKEQS